MNPSYAVKPGVNFAPNGSNGSDSPSISDDPPSPPDAYEREVVVLLDFLIGDNNDEYHQDSAFSQVDTPEMPTDHALDRAARLIADDPKDEDRENIVNFNSRVQNPRKQKKKSISIEVEPELVTRTAESAKKASESGDSRVSKESKGDFTLAYAAAKNKEIDMLEDSKNRDREIQVKRLEMDRKIAEEVAHEEA